MYVCNCSSIIANYITIRSLGKLYLLDCNLISVLVLTSCFNALIMTIFQSTWLQLDICPCSYQSFLMYFGYRIDSTLLCSICKLLLFDIEFIDTLYTSFFQYLYAKFLIFFKHTYFIYLPAINPLALST